MESQSTDLSGNTPPILGLFSWEGSSDKAVEDMEQSAPGLSYTKPRPPSLHRIGAALEKDATLYVPIY